jgi:PTS system mannose-specific IIB component
MIKMIRLDERMIHGQIAVKWSKYLGIDRIIVANDEAASSEIIKQSLLMAVPSAIKVAIVAVDRMIAMMDNPKAAEHDILVITANPTDLLKIVNSVKGIQLINIGNYGRSASANDHIDRQAFGDNLYATPEEQLIFRQIAKSGITAVYQTTPDDPSKPLSDIFRD